jgi:hypothetical protein
MEVLLNKAGVKPVNTRKKPLFAAVVAVGEDALVALVPAELR